MKFVCPMFFRVFFICIFILNLCDTAVASFCNGNNPAPAGEYCWSTQTHTCKPGCYCEGGNEVETGGELNHCNPADGTFKFGLISHSSPTAGVHVCPASYPNSGSGKSSITSCYSNGTCGANTDAVKANSENNGVHVDYGAINGCAPGLYIPFLSSGCASCPAGKYCAGLSGTKYTSCNNQGITGDCSEGNLYSRSGAAECSSCEEVGKAVVKQNGLNVNCQTCDAGKYANATHTNCDTCPKGYKCTGGIAIRCGFDMGHENQYQDEEGKTTCKTCMAPNGVTYTQASEGILFFQLHTGCTTCPDGKYSNNGICTTCEPGFACKGGHRSICPKGEFSTGGATECTKCYTYYTTPGEGSTSGDDCFLVRARLKLEHNDPGIAFPVCLLQGRINMTVVR